jgi:hypothetical protein
MKPIQHPTSNDVLRAPPGTTPEECRALFITRVSYDHPWDSSRSTPGVVSYWQPTPEQLALLNAGKPVWLSILGATHPPLAIGVEGDGRL